MKKGWTSQNLFQGASLKVGFPLLTGLIVLVAVHFGGMQARDAAELAALVAFGVALVLFIVDTQLRISEVNERVAAEAERVAGEIARMGSLVELSARMERSSLGPALLGDFLESASQVDERVNPLLQRLVRREVERVASFVRQLPGGHEIGYDGEDRDWMLGLTREAQSSIDAISLSTVDAGDAGLDGGLWTSDLGQRYLEFQREAIRRDVRIRRIFVVDRQHEEWVGDESFLRVTQQQRGMGVEVRMLDHELIPDWIWSMISDFIVFDGVVGFETSPASSLTAGQTRPGKLQTRLVPDPGRVRDLRQRFEQLWEQADPERQIDD